MRAPLIHGTCVALQEKGVLLLGASGSGKSDLALRLIDRGAVLVGDDYLEADVRATELWVRPVPRLAGMIEVRNVGILQFPFLAEVPIRLIVSLDHTPQRLPEHETETLHGIVLPRLNLKGYEASAPLKVELGLRHERTSP